MSHLTLRRFPRAAPAASAPKKTAGHRGGRVGRSGSMVAAANAAMAPAAGDHALALGGAALGLVRNMEGNGLDVGLGLAAVEEGVRGFRDSGDS